MTEHSKVRTFLAAAALALASVATVHAQIGETYYIPLPSTQVKIWADNQTNLAENDTLRVVVGLTVTASDSVLYWDHWEDGFEFDIQDPASPAPGAGAEIWGDQDCANGYRPDIAGPCTASADRFAAGDVLILTSDVPVPGDPPVRDPAQIRFDGGDKLFSTDLLAVTYASWPSTGVEAQLGDAVEVFRSDRWGSDFRSPVGTNLAGAWNDFTALSVMARENGTSVTIDADGTGAGAAVAYTLDEGESVLVTGIQVGATVSASPSSGVGTRTVQVDIMTSTPGSTYEGRWFNLPPTSAWDQSYYAPAATTVGGATNAANVFVYNPSTTAALTVTWERLVGGVFTSSTFSVPANSTVAQTLPTGTPLSAAHFFASSPFYAVSAIAINTTIFDWGYALVPESSLTPAAVVGWAPGSTNLNRDVNPLWVTAVNPAGGSTTLYVDEDGDPATGPNVDPNGNRYDVACVAANLVSIRVFDDGPGTPNPPPAGSCVVPSGDNDQTGMRLYTVDGTRIAAAWGQDVALAATGQPTELDMGTTVVPFSSLNAFKDGALLVDLNGNGGIDVGDTILYTTIIRNTGITPVTEIFVTDTLDSGTSYVPGTFEVDGLPVADDIAPGTPYPLDNDSPHTQGFVLVESPPDLPAPIYSTPLLPGGQIALTYQVLVLASAVDPIVNTVRVRSDTETYVDTSTNPIPTGLLQVSKTSNVPADAIPGQTIIYTMQVTNASTTAGVTGIRLTDGLPAGTTYVPQSTSVTGPRQLYVADRFGTVTPSYANNNGPNSWADGPDAGTAPDPWVEVDGGVAGPTGGDVQVAIGPGGGQLRLDHQSGGTPSATRLVDLTSYAGAGALRMARFDFSAPNNTDVNLNQDAVTLQCDADGAGAFTTLGTIDWLEGVEGPLLSGRSAFEIPTGCVSANTRIRFEVISYSQAGDFFFVDNVEVRAVDDRQNPATDDFSTFPGGGSGWLAPWTVVGTNVDTFDLGGGDIRLRLRGGAAQPVVTRQADLSLVNGRRPVLALLTLNLTTPGNVDNGDFLHVEASSDGSSFTTLASFVNDVPPSATAGVPGSFRSYDLTPYISATTTIRFRGDSLDDTGDTFYVDNVNIVTGAQASVTKDNVPAGANADLVDGVPSSIALPADSFALAPGETLTATFRVTVNDPQPLTRIVNTVQASAFESTQRVFATVIDPVSPGGQIGDRVWLDVDGDGVQDTGEPGLSGVTVELRDGVCTPGSTCPTAVTDLNGNYLFDKLKPGTYTVVVTSGVPAGLASPPYPPSQPVSIVTGDEVYTNVDFGYVPTTGTAVIGDRVWADADGDGIQDPGELGIGGVTVQLVGPGADGIFGTADDTVVSTTTDPDGTYLFTGVSPGTYVVRVSGAPLSGRTPTNGPQSVGASITPPIAVVANQVLTDVDFGYTAPGTFSVTDTFWVDEDQDGVFDPGERPIAGVTVNLVDSLGNVVGTTTSAADGTFTFSGVPNGNYTIVVTDNFGELAGRQATTADATAGQRAVTVSGANVTGQHFGYAQPGLIGDRVWSDADGDGVQDPGEAGIGGVTVQLLGPGPDGLLFTGDDVVLQTTTTAADGSYQFDNLVPGGYRVNVPVQAALTGYTQTGDPNVPNAPCGVSCDRQGSSTLTLGATDRNLDFGFRDTSRPDISGTVFLDADRDGVLDTVPPESGIANVEVALVNAGPDGVFGTADDFVVATTTTAANGSYTFPDVQNGNYRVEVRDGGGVLDGYDLTSGNDKIPVSVTGTSITGIDFGYNRSTATGTIGDTVFVDVDPPGPNGPDGLPGPTEPRLSGVTVRLYIDRDGDGVISAGDGAPIATTVTDANGEYLFSGLAANRYLVEIDETTLPDSTPNAVQDLVETTYPAGADPSRVINLSDGERYEGADFGYRPIPGTVVLGDFLWYDADGDGLQDPGETGIPGIDVNLIGAGPDGIYGTADDTSYTTTTDLDGSYLFTGLPPGNYLATYDQADILARGLNNQPTNLPAGQRTFSLTAAAGDVVSILDFGFNGGTFGSIGDLIWIDVDDDGVQDPGEPGLGAVTVNLLDGSGNILATTTTGPNGQYTFYGLPAGNYRVQVTDIGGVLSGLNLGTGTNPTGTIALAAGQNYLNADFGYVPSSGTGTIGTSIWHDLNADGTRQANEPPIEGVTVDVYFDSNGNGSFDAGIDNRIRTVTTDFNGNFELLGLPAGTYFVDVTDEAGVLSGFTLVDGPNDGLDDNSQVDPYTVVLTPGSPNDVTADFGYRDDIVTSALTITGTVFVDANADGTYQTATELPVQSVVVRLFRVVGGSLELIGVTTTPANGTYSFGDLPPGNYAVTVEPASTAVDGYLQTTQTTTGGIQYVTLTIANSPGNDFGFYNGGVITTPVTLSFFEAVGDESALTVRWQTATEVGHAGFDLWVWTGTEWRRLNEQLLRAGDGDSLDIRNYQLQVPAPGGSQLLLQETDIKGRSRFYGPFLVGQRHGHENLANERIDWAKVRLEHAAKAAARETAARAALESLVEPALLLRVETSGIQRVSYEQLAAAGLDLAGVSADDIAVTHGGVPVAIRVEPAGSFGPGSYVELVADALDTLYTGTDVFRISANGANALRVGVDLAPPGGAVETSYREPLRLERQRHYSFTSPTPDPWYDTQVLAYTTPASASFTFTTEGRVPGPVALTVDLWGVTNWPVAPDHHAIVLVNGSQVGDGVFFDGTEHVVLTADVPESLLLPGDNTLTVRLPGDTGVDFDLVQVDGYTVDYPRHLVAQGGRLDFVGSGASFEVQGLPSSDIVVYRQLGGTVERLTGGVVSMVAPGNYAVTFPGLPQEARYLVASAGALVVPGLAPVRAPGGLDAGPARMLILSHPDFIADLAPLVLARQAQGWSVKVVDVEDVYAEFGDDIFDPAAIRAYIAYAVANLDTEAVLLVGGDTYDYRNYLGYGGFSFLPSIYLPSGDIVRFAPSDGVLADLDGDLLSDVAIGRFPVRTSADVQALVEKTLQYGTLTDRKSLLLAADDYDIASHFSFSQSSEELASRVPPDWQIARVYLDNLSVPDARTALFGGLNSGIAVTSYMGHSGPIAWTFDGLFNNGDAGALTNSGLPTVVMQWGCWTSYFVEPANNTLAHELLLNGDQGAAAVLGASTLTEARSERALSLQLFDRVFAPGATLGQALLEAKQSLAGTGDPDLFDVVVGWNLLGDPTAGLGIEGSVPDALIFANGFEPGDVPWSLVVQ